MWIGRLFFLDNDFGEHWFDKWDLRNQFGLGYQQLVVKPVRFQDERNGPCNTRELAQEVPDRSSPATTVFAGSFARESPRHRPRYPGVVQGSPGRRDSSKLGRLFRYGYLEH